MVNTEYLITITVIFLLSEGLEQDHIAVKIPFRLILYKHQERKRDNGDLDQLPTNSQPVRLSLVTSEVAQTQPTPTQPNPTAFPNRA